MMLTWDQLAAAGAVQEKRNTPETGASLASRSVLSGMFSANNLKYGVFTQVPSPNVDELLRRFERVDAKRGDVIVREGAEGTTTT